MKELSFPAQNIHHLIFPGTDVLVAICYVVSMEVGQSRLVDGQGGERVNTTVASKNQTVVTDSENQTKTKIPHSTHPCRPAT